MQKLTLIVTLILGFSLYSQESDYKEISESDISVKYEKVIDTINNERLSWKWKAMKLENKEKIRSRILEMKKDIESDSSDVTKIYYFGNRENVGLKINGEFLKSSSPLAEYHSESIYGDSIFKINLGTIPRYSKVQSAEFFLKDLKRTAAIKIDSKYSLINIEVGHIRSTTDILKWEKIVAENVNKIKESGELPEPPDTIEVLEKEEILVLHKVPKRKHIW